MFINCPHCRALVATDPATDRAPPYCPICTAAIAPTVPAGAADGGHDRDAIRSDASRRLQQMLSSIDGDTAAQHAPDAATPAPGDSALDAIEGRVPGDDLTRADASTPVAPPESTITAPAASRRDAPARFFAPGVASRDRAPPVETNRADDASARHPPHPADDDDAHDGRQTAPRDAHDIDEAIDTGRVRVRPPGPPPVDVIRSPVEALRDPLLSLPPAAEMLERSRDRGIVGRLRRLLGSRGEAPAPAAPQVVDSAIVQPEASTADQHASDAAASTIDATDAVAMRDPDACAAHAPTPISSDDEPPTGTVTAPRADDALATADGRSDAPSSHAIESEDGTDPAAPAAVDDADAVAPTGDAPVSAIVRPVDRRRVELPVDADTIAPHVDPVPGAAPLPLLPTPLVATLPIGAAATRSAPSFARQRRQARNGFGLTTTAAVVVLGLVLALQLLLADRATLAADARWRPAVSTVCGALGCSVPAWREPDALAMLDRDVRPDPARPGVLRVTATFRNDARWPQPWPTLALTLSDADGATLARRHFSAREYLGAAPAQPELAPGQSASIAMDVIEPDTRSVAFDFLLH